MESVIKTFRSDCHIHSRFSPDAEGTSPDAVVKAALAEGLDGICFTEHCECNRSLGIPPEFPSWPDLDYDEYFKVVSDLKGKYPLKIAVGLELGQGTQGPEYAQKYIESRAWDFILASNHNLRDEYDFHYLDYRGKDINSLCVRYFEELYEVVEWGQFDVLAHLFYFVRYLAMSGHDTDMSKYGSIIEDILRLLALKGKGLEINTSGLFGAYGKTIPGIEQLCAFRKLGGEIVTVGSDAHSPDKVGYGGDIARELIRQAGFKYVAFYENRKPVFMPI